jgi:hypothetical protein
VPSTSFGTIPPQTATPTYNTTWFIPTATLNISTSTVTVDPSQISQLAALTVDCPITQDDYEAGWSIYDLPDDCTNALIEYCEPAINATQPPATSFPATCSPVYYENSTTAEPSTTVVASLTSSTLAPTQSGIAANCKNILHMAKTGEIPSLILSVKKATLSIQCSQVIRAQVSSASSRISLWPSSTGSLPIPILSLSSYGSRALLKSNTT